MTGLLKPGTQDSPLDFDGLFIHHGHRHFQGRGNGEREQER
jgi:hypothetical protein